MPQLCLLVMVVFGGMMAARRACADDQTLNRIRQRGTMVVGTSPDYPPFEFQINQNGKQTDVGIDIEIAKQIAKDQKVKLQLKNMSFASLLVAVQTGKVDMAIGGINPTPERAQNVDFSKIYYSGGQSFLINKSQAGQIKSKKDLEGKKIGAQSEALQYTLAKKNIPKAQVTGMEKTPDLVLALKTHKLDAVGVEKPVAAAYTSNDPELKAIDAGYQLGKNDVGAAIAVQKGNPAMVRALNQSIDRIHQQQLIPGYIKQAGKHMKANTQNTSMWHYWKYFANGVQYTLIISVVSIFFGIILGVLLALLRLSRFRVFRWLSISYTEVVRGTPMMVQVLLVYFGLGVLINIPALTAGIIAVSLNSGAYVSEIIRGGINSVAKGQTEAAKSLGLNASDTMRFVILPQSFKNIWPALGNEFITIIKESSIVSIIGVTDLVYQLNVVRADTYRGVAPIIVAMVIYFVISFILTRILNFYERSMNHG
ncbi:polar amino acid ABC transporter inner membrane subunit [Fructilactobacillus florum DSM 22689 = JCM 16035]|uniref:Polar amino acid ABC transporter inner membrane subunit n=2 Tax=Fructilactobacillus florum TaxID=640331 RepID=A0A0R2CDJ2_9LACO|nr:polar amino acid ABC transporter inner membrane subunit [Fructilactobacillus florum DSM 22689 = JCM 16035]